MLDPLPKSKEVSIPRIQLDQLRHINAIRSEIADLKTREDGAVPIIGLLSDDTQDSEYADVTDLTLGEDIAMSRYLP